MRVSVIIPNYNHAPYLDERIESVLNQTYKDFEVIILDDSSTDNSRDVIEKYRGHEKIRGIVYNEQNSGSTFKQWQKGIALAQGEWIWIAESDDSCEISFLEKMLRGVQGNVGVVACKVVQIDSNGKIDRNDWFWPEDILQLDWSRDFCMDGIDFIYLGMRYKNCIPNASAVVFNRGFSGYLEEIESFRFNGDWFFWFLFLKNTRFVYI